LQTDSRASKLLPRAGLEREEEFHLGRVHFFVLLVGDEAEGFHVAVGDWLLAELRGRAVSDDAGERDADGLMDDVAGEAREQASDAAMLPPGKMFFRIMTR
jgi:hypothetical protein